MSAGDAAKELTAIRDTVIRMLGRWPVVPVSFAGYFWRFEHAHQIDTAIANLRAREALKLKW